MILFCSQNQKTEDESEEQAIAYIKCPERKRKKKGMEFRRNNTRNNRLTVAPAVKMAKLQKILY